VKEPSIKKLDRIWADLVKIRDGGKCVYCGKVGGLNAHNIFSRTNKYTRWYIPNGVSLCVACHVFSSTFSAHKTPCEFTDWIRELNGDEWYNNLRLKAHSIEKRTRSQILEEELSSNTLHPQETRLD